jgi:hypothetical protein
MRNLRYCIRVGVMSAALLPVDAGAAGIAIENHSTMASFQSSPFYAYVTGGVGLSGRKAHGVRGVRQGPNDVPASSAGAAGNSVVTPEVISAARDVPDVFSLSSTASDYNKKFVSLGTQSGSVNPPFITLDVTPVSTSAGGGYGGYDLAVIDLGKNLADNTGNQNTEATTFEVELVSEGVFYPVGTINATLGNFLNVILLDISGIPGIPGYIDAIRVTDVTGAGNSSSGGLDVDGAITLNVYNATPVAAGSWGRIKALYR